MPLLMFMPLAFLSAQVKEGKLFVNDIPRVEPFINEPPAYLLEKYTVPAGDVSGCGEVHSSCPTCS